MMDALDLALMDAFERVGARLLDRPWELVKRMERVRRAELRRPVRAWAVAVRASDARIGEGGYSADRPWGDYGCPTSEHLASRGRRHRVTLTEQRLAALVKPVRVDGVSPAASIPKMAALLGRDYRTVFSWLKQGRFEAQKQWSTNGQGARRWMLRTRGPIDPQADAGQPPLAWWGSSWEYHWQRLPGDLRVRLMRVPRLRSVRRRQRSGGSESDTRAGGGGTSTISETQKWVGWDWRCPGRIVEGRDGQPRRIMCGRACKKLWLPLPAWTVGDYLQGRGGAGQKVWEQLPRVDLGERGLACARCWGMRHDTLAATNKRVQDEVWNRFVTVITGGMLYGREVQRPGA